MTKFGKSVLLVGILLILGVGLFFFQKVPTEAPVEEIQVIDNSMPEIGNKDLMQGNKDDLISFSVWPNAKVTGILSYRGSIKGGYFFEANILINILDKDKKVLKSSNAVAKTDWMTAEPVEFEGNIDFTGLPKGEAYFEIHNDNASALPENDKSILIPIVIE
jgi:Immunoglobulin-like domain of bacterial spore germination